jgi:hypothetical protein
MSLCAFCLEGQHQAFDPDPECPCSCHESSASRRQSSDEVMRRVLTAAFDGIEAWIDCHDPRVPYDHGDNQCGAGAHVLGGQDLAELAMAALCITEAEDER